MKKHKAVRGKYDWVGKKIFMPKFNVFGDHDNNVYHDIEESNSLKYEVKLEKIDGHVLVKVGCQKHIVHNEDEFRKIISEALRHKSIKNFFGGKL
jgi:hypothetical protein